MTTLLRAKAATANAYMSMVRGPALRAKPLLGIGATTAELALQQWPADRRSGLTFGEIFEIERWLRNYGAPLIASGARNELGQTALDALIVVMKRWAAINIAAKDEFFDAYKRHVEMLHWAASKGIPKATDFYASRAVYWPTPAVIRDKIKATGNERWLRYVAAMAIGRDLFAEELAHVGGVQPGLQDSIEQTQLTGTAVRGEWVNLAGVWRWKGYSVDGRPINVSEPLFAAPQFSPFAFGDGIQRNRQIFKVLFTVPPEKIAAPVARAIIPQIVKIYNGWTEPMKGAEKLADPPLTPTAAAEVLAALFNLRGIDARVLFGDGWEQIEPHVSTLVPLPKAPAVAAVPEGVSGVGCVCNQLRKLRMYTTRA